MDRMHLWESRFKRGETGICVNQNINLKESVACETLSSLEKKVGVNEKLFVKIGLNLRHLFYITLTPGSFLAKC